jgi:protein TonB
MTPRPQEFAIFPALPRRTAAPGPRSAAPARLISPLGLSIGLHALLLALGYWGFRAHQAPGPEPTHILDVAAFVEMVDLPPCETEDEVCLEQLEDPLLPEEALEPLLDLPEPTTDDALPELPVLPPEQMLAERPRDLIDVPLDAALRLRAPEVAPPAPEPTPAAAPPAPMVTPPAVLRVLPRPAAAPRPPAARLRVATRPNMLSYYPLEARRKGIEGKAIVLIEVDTRGLVIDAQVLESSGSDLLDRQALRYLYDMRFEPGAGGKTRAPVHFRLR